MTKAEYMEKAGNDFAEKIRSMNLTLGQIAVFNKVIQPKYQDCLHALNEILGEEKSIELQEFYLKVNKEMYEIAKSEKK